MRVRGLAGNEAQAQPILQGLRAQGYTANLQGDVLVVGRGANP